MSKALHLAFVKALKYYYYNVDEKIEIIKECIDGGVDINFLDSEILIQSCMVKDMKILKVLLEMGANPSARNNTPLMESINNLEYIKLLIAYGADPFANGNQLLIGACIYPRIDVVKYLLSINADCSWPNNKPIISAFGRRENYELKELILEHGADPNSIINDMSLLEYSVYRCNLKNCELLFKYGADINSCQNIINKNYDLFDIKFPSHKSTIMNSIVSLFINYGLDISEVINVTYY